MRFKRVYVEIGNICNLNCSFCSEVKREKRQMTVSEFSHIAKEVKPFCDYLYFHIKGEPLLHPHLSEFFDIAEEYNFLVNITTNVANKLHFEILLKYVFVFIIPGQPDP